MDVKKFMSSLAFDKRLAPYDIKGSIAHAAMLGKSGIITSDEAQKIIQGLKGILSDIKKGKMLPDDEDIHMAVEQELIKRIGDTGGKLHAARSRNDQVALDMMLFVKDCIKKHQALLQDIQKTIIALCKKNSSVIMPAMTHLQHGQPVLLAHHLLAYAWMFDRDKGRLTYLLHRMNECPLGSAACAGTSFPIDRKYTAQELGFEKPSENSMDSVSNRDYIVELLSTDALIMMHISRLAEEMVLWMTQEFNFAQLADTFTSGSSIMPQKRNPDFAEIIRGKTGRVYGNLMGILTILKGLPLTYNRDLQEDKPLLFDTVDTVEQVLYLLNQCLNTIHFNKQAMITACSQGYMEATELADYLVLQGIPFRKAHSMIKQLVSYCIKKQKKFNQLNSKELKLIAPLLDLKVIQSLHCEAIVSKKTSYGGTSHVSVKHQIQLLKKSFV